MHVDKRARRITGTGGKDKSAVMGILERGGKVRTAIVPNRKKKALQGKSASTLKRVPLSTPMRFCRMTGWPENTRIR